MSSQYSIFDKGVQASAEVDERFSHGLRAICPLMLANLAATLDVRLLQTFVATLHVLLRGAVSPCHVVTQHVY